MYHISDQANHCIKFERSARGVKNMRVMKFGGTSIKDARAIRNVAGIIETHIHTKPVVVVSAMAGVTDILQDSVKAAAGQDASAIQSIIEEIEHKHVVVIKELLDNTSYFTKLRHAIHTEVEKLAVLLSATRTIRIQIDDLSHAVLSIGELLSSVILSTYLNYKGLSAQWVDAREIMVTTNHNKQIVPVLRSIKEKAAERILPLMQKEQAVITQGFISATSEGVPTTLGRNGSDFSASLLGAAIGAEQIQIWTDVDGILTADPTIIPTARVLETMTFDEASELAYFGGRVLYPAAIQPALEKGIPVYVLNSTRPQSRGTLILNHNVEADERPVKSIVYKENITLITIQASQLLLNTDMMGRLFQRLSDLRMRVYAVSKSATKLTLTVEGNAALQSMLSELPDIDRFDVMEQKAIISVVGERMKEHPQLAWKIIKMLQDKGIPIDLISQFATQISFMFIIDENNINQTIHLLHHKLIENNTRIHQV
ncbi:MAG: aspartate kinase [Caldithrix sp.]|nr:aspartate kinase [Caldithrix sp.]